MSDVQATRIRTLIDSKLADHKITHAEYNQILAQVKIGWISQDEVDGANAVAAVAEQEADEAASGVLGSMSRALLEAMMDGTGDLSGVGDAAKKAMDALERRDAARQLRQDLDAGRKGQGWMAKKLADWLPEKTAEYVKNLF
jgi:hypothetical protein